VIPQGLHPQQAATILTARQVEQAARGAVVESAAVRAIVVLHPWAGEGGAAVQAMAVQATEAATMVQQLMPGRVTPVTKTRLAPDSDHACGLVMVAHYGNNKIRHDHQAVPGLAALLMMRHKDRRDCYEGDMEDE
jgi:hypothetical protein